MSFEKSFGNPSCEFRGKPFWAWNGRLEKKELERQIDVFKEMGLGGAFMHSRVGLGTAYLSEEWFDLVGACAAKAKANGMEAWLYDEDRWPSGAAGGLVTKDERYRMRFLRMDVLSDASEFKADGKEIALFSAKISGRDASNLKRLAKGSTPALAKGESLLVFREELHPCSSWYNSYTYLDTMNEEAVDKFVEVTHEAYLKHNGKDFGKTIPGIFTDEPHYGHGRSFNGKSGTAQWTGALPATFSKRYGYDLLDHLPEIFFFLDKAKFSTARRDYYDCITHLFVNAFGRKVYEFCEKAGIEFTGHVLEEPHLISQTQAVGAAMRFYEFMQAPGIDILCAQGLKRDGGNQMEITTAKQCESMRRQFGRKHMLSELYGCTGWNFTFAEHKAVGDWQAAMGVNIRCQHLSWYTMEGEAKRDYPASISFQSAWCKEYKAVEDYFSRVNVALAEGEAVRDVAILHPIESGWGAYVVKGANGEWGGDNGMNAVSQKLTDRLDEIIRSLLRAHCDFDFIDEEILSRYGAVEGSSLKLNLASYKVVVVPPILCVRPSSAKILADFVKAGGTVLIVPNSDKELLALEQGGALDEVKKFAKPVKAAALASAASKAGAAKISLKSARSGKEYGESLYMMRRDAKAGRTIVFVTHSLQDCESGALELEIPAVGKVYELDPVSGAILSVPGVSVKAGRSVVKTDLPACGSRLFLVEDASAPVKLKASGSRLSFKRSSAKPLSLKKAAYKLDEPNAIPLDMAEYSSTGGVHGGPFEVLKLDRIVRDVCGLPYRSGDMVQPWARKPVSGYKTRRFSIKYSFKVDVLPSNKLWLVLERPSECLSCQVNGKPLELKDQGWWLDNSFRKIALPASLLRTGLNSVSIDIDYGPSSGLEAAYLLGEFGFKREAATGLPVMTALPESVGAGDWAKYSLGTYTGSLGYVLDAEIPESKGSRVFLKLGDWEGVVAKVLVDGKEAGRISWQPYELDITEAVAGKRKCEIEVKLFAGRRNLLGPLHLSVKNPVWTGPGEFVPGSDRWSPDHMNFPVGLMKDPSIVVKS